MMTALVTTRSSAPSRRLPFGGLAHAVADGLAAAEDQFVAICGVVVLDLGDEPGVGQMDLVAGGRAVLHGVFGPRDLNMLVVSSPGRALPGLRDFWRSAGFGDAVARGFGARTR